MKKKEFVVIGCGRFGISCALTLADLGYNVLVIDANEDTINELADKVTHAVVADVRQEKVLEDLGVKNFDTAIVSISSDFQASIMATIACKDLGVSTVIAKAKHTTHARILKKVGADRVVIPEKEMGIKLATTLTVSNIMDYIELSDEYSMLEIKTPRQWAGESIDQLNIRKNFGISIVALLRGEKIVVNPMPTEVLRRDDAMIVIGENADILNLEKMSDDNQAYK